MSEDALLVPQGVVNPLKRPAHDGENCVVEEKKPCSEFQRVKRRKYAMLISYSGHGYFGLQRNPGTKTIEEDLMKAMLDAGVITDDGYAQPKSIGFQRAARTDKGVSAVRQVLSIKLPVDVDIKSINDRLPEQVRVMGLKRVTKGFNSKGNCDARTYSYMMPTFALAPQEEPIRYDYRIPTSTLDATNEVLQKYIGTHNFHNFTSRKNPLDPSAKRYIISFSCGDVVLADDMEFVILKVKGQSFMLHQIRKMVGLVVAIVRGLTTVETLTKAWEEPKLDLPVAPGLGLVLEEVHYDRYNKKFGSDGIHENIEWSSQNPEIEEFRKRFILSNIYKTEKEEKSMELWLEKLSGHSFDVRENNKDALDNQEDEDEGDDDAEDKPISVNKDSAKEVVTQDANTATS